MGKINPYRINLYACGVGGGNQSIHVHDIITNVTLSVLANAAGSEVPGGPTWLDVEHVVGQLCDGTCRLVRVNTNDFSVVTLLEDGINHCCAGGSRWSAQGLHGTYINGVRDDTLDPIVYSLDKTLAYTNLAHQGLWLKNPDESIVQISLEVIDQESVHVLGMNQAVWIERGKIKSTWPITIQNLPGEFGWTRGVIYQGVLHLMYHHYNINKVILHPWNSLIGWVLGDGLCYYPDIQYDGRILNAIYNHVANDNPETMVECINIANQPKQDLTKLLVSKPPIELPPVPVEPPVFNPAPNKIETVRRIMRLHPEINPLDELARGKIVDYVINAEGGKPWGRKARNANGSNKNTDGLTYLESDGTFQIIDVISGGDPGGSNPDRFATWDNTGRDWKQGENGFWAPGEPISNIPPVENPPPANPPVVSPVVSLDTWLNKEFPQLVAAYKSTHDGNDPNYEWAAFQTYRRYMEPNVWTFDKMLAWELSQ